MEKLEQFDFNLPKKLIAQKPAHPRDHSRLLIYDRANQSLTDDYFYNIESHLVPDTTLVLNNSKVEKARLNFGSTEIFITKQLDERTIEALVRPGRKFKAGSVVELADDIGVEVLRVLPDGQRQLRMQTPLSDERYMPYRKTPFPPYIAADESLSGNYQTIYAKAAGSRAAPTAGLHFTPELLGALRQTHRVAEVTLHVGLGTFAPLRKQQLETGKLHEEAYVIDEPTAELLNKSTHITAVGTTAARVLESAANVQRKFKSGPSQTDIFIKPGYEFKATDSIITNFHLPKSSLLMLVSAMTGVEQMHRIYRYAIEQEYRFYSFGDAMLIK